MLAALKKKTVIIISILALFFATALLLLFQSSKNKPSLVQTAPTPTPFQTANITIPPGQKIARVGEETIYQKDLDEILAIYPDKSTQAHQKILEKLIADSKTIQHAKEIGLIKTDDTIYNSPDKDNLKRTREIQKIQETIRENNYTIKGSGVSVWFVNDYVGPLGYEKAKELALAKINFLYNAVKTKTMTMEQAAENIRNDTSLAKLDKNYVYNAYFTFSLKPGQKFTYEENFDKILWQLPAGEMTEVYTAASKDLDDGKDKPAYYMFAQVEEKLNQPIIADVDTNKYEVNVY